MKHKILILLSCITFLFAGCGNIPDEFSSVSTLQTKPVPENSNENSIPEDKPQDSSGNETFIESKPQNSNELTEDETAWEYALNNYSHVTYDEIQTDAYNNQYVIVSSVINSVEYFDIMNWVKCECWFTHNSSYVKQQIIFECEKMPNYDPCSLAVGDNIDICVYVNRDNSFGSKIKSFNITDSKIALSDIIDTFKNNCSTLNYKEILRYPDNFWGNTYCVNGSVLQVVSEKDNRVELLLFTGNEDEYIYVSYESDPDSPRILENDDIKVYGTYYKLFSYTSMLGTKHSIPSIVAEFIDIN